MKLYGRAARAAASLARVVRIPNFLSQDDIALVRRLERAHHERLGHPPLARRGWQTTYLSAGGLLRAAAPALHRRLGELRYKVDLSPLVPTCGPAASEELLRGLEARCIELHEGRAGGSLDDPRHFDNGSVVTVDMMLDDSFTGGALRTLEADGTILEHDFAVGRPVESAGLGGLGGQSSSAARPHRDSARRTALLAQEQSPKRAAGIALRGCTAAASTRAGLRFP